MESAFSYTSSQSQYVLLNGISGILNGIQKEPNAVLNGAIEESELSDSIPQSQHVLLQVTHGILNGLREEIYACINGLLTQI